MKFFAVFIGASFLLAGCATTTIEIRREYVSPIKAAEAWLALLDNAQYDATWETAAAPFQSAIGKEQWRIKVSHILDPLGKLQSRKMISKTYETALPAFPDGEYLVMKFSSTYGNKESSMETVTSML